MTTQIQLGAISSSAVSSLQGPRITTVVVTDNTYAAIDDTAVDSTSGGYIKITGSGFVSGCIVTVGNVTATSTTFVSSTEVRAQIGAQAAGSYNVYVSNPDGSLAIKVLGVNYSGMPAWSTSSSQTFTAAAVSFQFTATSDSTVTYSVNAGSSLPGGLSLSSSGLLSGNATGTSGTVYTFTLQATDVENQNTPRTFTVTLSFADPYFRYTTLLIHANGTDGANNNVLVDSSNNNLTITRSGTPSQGTFSPFSLTGWSAYFNGSTDYLYHGTTALNFLATGGTTGIAATIEAWVYTTAYNAGGSAWMFNPIIALGGTYMNFGVSSGKVRFYWYDGGYKYVDSASTNDVPLNTWVHICITISTTTIKIFVNGTLSTTSATYTGIASAGAGNAVYTSYEANAGYKHSGYISNLRVVNDIVYTNTFTPSTTPLTAVANTKLLVFQDNCFIDRSTNNFAATITGSPSIQPYSPFGPSTTYSSNSIGGSIFFNSATPDYFTVPSNTALSIGTGDYTFECWIYRTTTTRAVLIGITGAGLSISINTSNQIEVCRTLTAIDFTFTSLAVKNNTWQHIAVVRIGTNLNAYINGVSAGTTQSSSTSYGVGTTYIGIDGNGSSTPFGGYISGMRLVKGSGVYSSSFTAPTTPPTNISGTSLLFSGTNAAIYDQTSKNNLITTGVTKVSNTQSKFGNSSVYMSGSYLYAVPTTGSPTMQFNAGDFTVETWVYVPAAGGYQTIFTNRPPTATNGSFWYGFYTGTLQPCWIIGGGLVATSNVAVTANTWTHVAATRQSGTLKLWVGGQLTNTYSDAYSYTDSGCGIGVSHNEAAYGLTGYLDDVRVTKGYARYTSNFTPATLAFNDQ